MCLNWINIQLSRYLFCISLLFFSFHLFFWRKTKRYESFSFIHSLLSLKFCCWLLVKFGTYVLGIMMMIGRSVVCLFGWRCVKEEDDETKTNKFQHGKIHKNEWKHLSNDWLMTNEWMNECQTHTHTWHGYFLGKKKFYFSKFLSFEMVFRIIMFCIEINN